MDEPMDPYEPVPVDGLLLVLAHMARTHDGFEIGITINVPGALVTGILVGPQQWLEVLGAMGEGPAKTFLSAMAGGVAKLQEEVPDDSQATQYLHLREAQYVSGGTFSPSEVGTLWRGRISAVAGWSMGTISPGS